MSGTGDGADATMVGVSIPVPEPWGGHLQDKRASYGDPRASAIPAHVTLLGPTPLPAVEVDELVAHLERVADSVEAFTMVLRGTGTFRPVSDVVFVQVARGISGCELLQEAIRTPRWAAELDFPYHPHVTIAHDVDEPSLDRAFDDLAEWTASFEVGSFHLYVQDATGVWTPIREFELVGSRAGARDVVADATPVVADGTPVVADATPVVATAGREVPATR